MRIDANAFAAKYSSKGEVYKFLTHDCAKYLPDYECVTIFHMRDIVAGRRRSILEVDVSHINVPHYEGLKVEAML